MYFEEGGTASRVIVDFLLKCIMRVLYVQFVLCSIDVYYVNVVVRKSYLFIRVKLLFAESIFGIARKHIIHFGYFCSRMLHRNSVYFVGKKNASRIIVIIHNIGTKLRW